MSLPTDFPEPPLRLLTDNVLLKKNHQILAWESRRANKMRERFATGFDHQPLPSMNLVAPVQPTLCSRMFSERAL